MNIIVSSSNNFSFSYKLCGNALHENFRGGFGLIETIETYMVRHVSWQKQHFRKTVWKSTIKRDHAQKFSVKSTVY